jgi:predicted nucleotide-binding protein (sugar kinase/HSP70/actin superfamily)
MNIDKKIEKDIENINEELNKDVYIGFLGDDVLVIVKYLLRKIYELEKHHNKTKDKIKNSTMIKIINLIKKKYYENLNFSADLVIILEEHYNKPWEQILIDND